MILYEGEFDKSLIENEARNNRDNTDRICKFLHASYWTILRLLKRPVKGLK
jgi:hypothetical protein